MDSYKTFISQISGYKWNTICVTTIDAERACRVAQREALDKAISELNRLLKRDNDWISLSDAIKNINSIRDSIQDGWKK
jgi:hypothetical protein